MAKIYKVSIEYEVTAESAEDAAKAFRRYLDDYLSDTIAIVEDLSDGIKCEFELFWNEEEED